MAHNNSPIVSALRSGVCLGALALVIAPLSAEENETDPVDAAPSEITAQLATSVQASAAQIEENQRYVVRTMAQIYNGRRDVSHTQVIGIGRMRKGNESVSRFDFGDGAVVITDDTGGQSASRFLNVSKIERAVTYDYSTKTLSGDAELAEFHNRLVRPWLGEGPALGKDASWKQVLPFAALGIGGTNGGELTIELGRTYFTHQGKPMVLVEYAIPEFSYETGLGSAIVQWGRGFALTDPGFGMIYINAALHRAVETGNGGPARPYRYARALVAANPDGSAMIDYREVEQIKHLIEPVMGANAMRVVSVASPEGLVDKRPIEIGRKLDLMALSIGEDGANEVPIGAGVQTGGDRGAEVPSELVGQLREALGRELGVIPAQVPDSLINSALQQIGARGMTNAEGVFTTSSSSSDLMAEEVVQTDQSGGAGGASGLGSNQALNAAERAMQQQDQASAASSALETTMMDRKSQTQDAKIISNTPPAPVLNQGSGLLAADDSSSSRAEDGATPRGGSAGLGDVSTADLQRAVENATNEVMQQNGWDSSDPFGTTPETLQALNESRGQGGDPAGDAFARVRGGGADDQVFGNQGGDNNAPITALDVAEGGGNFLNTVLGYTDKGVAITGGFLASETTKLAELGKSLGQQLDAANESYRQASARLMAQGKVTLQLTPMAEEINSRLASNLARSARIEEMLNRLSTTMADFTKTGGAIPPDMMREASDLVNEFNALQDSIDLDTQRMGAIPNKYIVTFDQSDPFTARLLDNVEQASSEVYTISRNAQNVEREANALQRLVRNIPTEKIGDALEYFGNSPAGKVLDGVSHGMNIYTTTTGINSTIDAAYSDKSSGNLNLTRDHSISGLALDIAALAGHAYSGNVAAFVSDATAITVGSVSDVFLTAKALRDTNRLNNEILRQQRLLDEHLSRKRQKKVLDLGELIKEAGGDLTDLEQTIDDTVNTSKERLEERRQAREEVERQREEEARRREERERQRRAEREAREEENERRRTANDRLKDAIEDKGYPTRDPSTVPVADKGDDVIIGQTSDLPPDVLARIEREKRRAENEEWLREYQEEKLRQRREAEKDNPARNGGSDIRLSSFELSELVVSKFDIDPVTFEPPVWEPPVWEPPEWTPPEFDAPDISRFPPTDPDDQDGYPGTGEYPSFVFESISGTINTDLSRWEKWLATQDIRYLGKLAMQAGYPYPKGHPDAYLFALAAALADAENIIRLSQDAGYRQWANRAPSCSGYVGCGPSYLERWSMKRSIVALGDILAPSRGIFSTGGFSDIGISGFNLMYILRDFGIQDGDLIDVDIFQFGRRIGGLKGHFLLTAGSSFNVRLRPGVAQLVVTALNEGSASPNTAEVTIGNVVRGNGVQTFSLETGQTATLRIEADASASSGNNSSQGSTSGTQSTSGVTPSSAPPIAATRSNRGLSGTPAPASTRGIGDPLIERPYPKPNSSQVREGIFPPDIVQPR